MLQVNFAAAPMLGTLVQKGYLTRRTLLVIGLLVVSTDSTLHWCIYIASALAANMWLAQSWLHV